MPSLKFILQSKKNPANIYVRLMLSKDRDYKRKTGLMIDPKKWNAKKGMPKHPGETYMALSELADRIWSELEKANAPDGKWLDGTIHGSNETLLDVIDTYIEDAPNIRNGKGGKGLSNNRVKNLTSFSKLMDRFGDVPISMAGKDYAKRLMAWMEGYSNNYITKTVENLKGVVRYAENKGISVDRSILSVQTYWERKPPVILDFDDLKTIKGLVLGEKLSNVRKWLLFGCYTGQRAGDLFRLSESDIRTVRGKKIIEIRQEKTFNRAVIPLVPEALEVIEDGFPRPISQQKFNKYVRELMGLAGIEKHITTHCMRRSFASNYYGAIPTPLLMQVTGHKKESSFLVYIGKSEYDMAFEFLEHYGKK
ncbi:MAG TPA: tyrosine-type recombinase/integrase [Pricia sp.]|nr:tyrosine-type recombinase/integrase [Pricia sp.]